MKPWLSYLNSYSSSTYTNIRAVAYMLDTNVWSTFKDNAGKAEYAIGGPTLDLFCASYNEKYPTKTIQYKANSTGYQVKWSSDSSYSNYIDDLSTNDSLYIINNIRKAYAMWIASPSADSNGYLMAVYFYGRLYGDGYNNDNPGFRPIVCLKSNVGLEQQSDGTYKIN